MTAVAEPNGWLARTGTGSLDRWNGSQCVKFRRRVFACTKWTATAVDYLACIEREGETGDLEVETGATQKPRKFKVEKMMDGLPLHDIKMTSDSGDNDRTQCKTPIPCRLLESSN